MKQTRGYIDSKEKIEYSKYRESDCITLLKSDHPVDRTLGARVLKQLTLSESTVDVLIEALKHEKKLYPKIEISELLTQNEDKSLSKLLPLLGAIGKNQYKSIPEEPFLKKSYPLPRDIIARIIAKMSKNVLAQLFEFAKNANKTQLLELIDAIGFISFYSDSDEFYSQVESIYCQYVESEFVRWRLIRCMSAYRLSYDFLQSIKNEEKNDLLIQEIDRSLSLIG
jgi:hypothetical protein